VTVKFRVELVWTDADNAASSIFLTADGRVILQGRRVAAGAHGAGAARAGRHDQRRPQSHPRHQGHAL